jgi:hypothetical protein
MPTTWKTSDVWAVVGLVMLALTQPCQCLAADQAEPASLEIQLEDKIFLEGQSVYMIACVRNTGTLEIYDVAPLPPGAGYLRLGLFRRDTGERLTNTMPIDGRSELGPTLRPGEVLCDVRDLTAYFGDTSTDTLGFAGRLGSPSLPAGEYVLEYEYYLHTRRVGGDARSMLKGERIPFSIKKLSSDPKEEALVTEFLAGLPRVEGLDRRPLQDYTKSWLPRFYGSKFLVRAYLTTGPLLKVLDFDPIFEGALRAGAPPERLATLIGVRLRMVDQRNQFTPEWKGRMKNNLTHQVELDALSIEPRHPQPK